MKRCLVMLLSIVLLLGMNAVAEELEGKTQEELLEMIAQLQQENAQLREQLGIEGEETENIEEPGEYIELAKGSKGDEAKALQKRLIELGYLTGAADGIYGNGTAAAVSSFQSQNGLPVTGTADIATQELLFSDQAERAIVYESLKYEGVSRDPDVYKGRYVKFTGRVLQVIEDGNLIAFRVATKGKYDDVVFVIMIKPESYSRILEDDNVTVAGKYGGLYSYETVRGDTLTIPQINADTVTLK